MLCLVLCGVCVGEGGWVDKVPYRHRIAHFSDNSLQTIPAAF